jgi:hypothetical protein
MKVTQILKHRGRELYSLGLKLIFIYAEYSGPTLFASLMNLCIAKVPESLERIKALYNWQGRTALFYLKLPMFAKLLSKLKISRVNLWPPEGHMIRNDIETIHERSPYSLVGTRK